MRKAVFLDRDGVLNQTIFKMGKPRAPYTLEEFSLLPGVFEGIQLLKDQNYLLIVVTNQPDVARGWVTKEAVEMINLHLKKILPVDEIVVCYHTEFDQCFCRKPNPGMLLEAARKWNIDLLESYMVGDRYSDIEAGKKAGCRTILIGEGDAPKTIQPDYQKVSLLEAARLVHSFNH